MARVMARTMSDKKVMSVDGKELGILHNIVVDIKTGNILDLVVRPDMDLDTSAYRSEGSYILVPSEQVRAVKDVIVVEKS